MTPQQITILTLAAVVLVLLGLVAWAMWVPVKRTSTVELQVQEFRRQMRDWENASQNDR